MTNSSHSLIEIIIVVVIIAILLSFAMPALIKPKLNAVQTYAQATLRTLSAAAETYASVNNGNFPTDFRDDLYTSADPKYLLEDFLDGVIRQGYLFSCTSNTTSYSCSSVPQGALSSQANTYTIATGGVLTTTLP